MLNNSLWACWREGYTVRGLQKGGRAFSRAKALGAIRIGTKVAVGTQVLLKHTSEIFEFSTAAWS
ncbi:hypothetical protein EDD21DRAFT_410312 [Dissophora ornata]|nr:hypothetical protein BGZ58_000889 [Dissophora ornata]KAI8606289.1 hypothetical protein EDD21DRAFT_410312 [Dissophora ornata]